MSPFAEKAALVPLACVALAACGGSETPGVSTAQPVKFDQFCAVADMKPALRQTLVVIDASAVRPSTPETFRSENAELLSLVTGVAEPTRAVSSGAMAPRERLTISVADPVSGGLKQIFTGCVPGVSEQELGERASKGEDGAAASYFGSDLQSKISEGGEAFWKQALLSLVQVKPSGAAPSGDGIKSVGVARVFKSIGPSEPGVIRRVFVYTDAARGLNNIDKTAASVRAEGFRDAQQLQADLGKADIHMVPAGRPLSDAQGSYLDALLLGIQGNLRSFGPFSPNTLSKPPVKVLRYTGDLPLAANVRTPMEMQLAVAVDGSLVNSWISYTGSQGVRSTPVTGQFACAADASCDLRGDPNMALGQRWKTEMGTAAQPLPGGPFGGMRMISGKDDGQTFAGRIYDPIIYVGERGDIRFTANKME